MTLETRPYGQKGDMVSVIGLGGAGLYQSSFADGVATVHRALELGVTYFDTSPEYGGGMSQAVLRGGLEGRSEKYLVATKLGRLGSRARYRSYDALRAQLDENLVCWGAKAWTLCRSITWTCPPGGRTRRLRRKELPSILAMTSQGRRWYRCSEMPGKRVYAGTSGPPRTTTRP